MASIRARVQKRTGATSWTVQWREPSTGERKSRTFKVEDNAIELKMFLDANHNTLSAAEMAKRKKTSTAPTVAELVADHIKGLRRPQPDTLAKYRRMARNHVYGSALGETPADLLTPEAVNRWLDGLVSAGIGERVETGAALSVKSKVNVLSLVSAALKTELKREHPCIARNVAAGASPRREVPKREPVYLTPEDVEALLAAAPARWVLFLRVLAFTGLRFNEATALRSRDVTFAADGRATIHVTRAYKDGQGEDGIGLPKTSRSRRVVSCSFELSETLREHAAGLGQDDLLFTNLAGGRLTNSRFHKLCWQALVTRLVASGTLPRAPWIHELRHAHTTHLLLAGVPVHVVQRRLGHEDPSTTLKIYSHMTGADDIAAADALSPGPPAASAGGGDGGGLVEQLRGLAELHEAGVLDAGEFAAAKAALLGV